MKTAVPYCLCWLPLLLPLLVLPASVVAQAYSNKTLGSSLTAGDNESWASESGEFAFGFKEIGTGGYLLAVWFNKISEKTVVWSANGGNLVKKGSKVQLTSDGNFVLNDQEGEKIWPVDSTITGVAYAAMLDSGNFVLVRQDSINLWESFDNPTDTILPTQALNQGSKLVARLSETNYSSGRFMFKLQSNGSLTMYTTDFPQDSENFPYWSSQTTGFQVIFNQSGSIYLKARNGSKLMDVLTNEASTEDYYQRAILEYDGVFRQYVYPKSAGSSAGRPMAWSSLTSFVPENICTSIRAETGSGACGFNSYCTMGNDDRPYCQCPPGYTFLDAQDDMSGCKQNFVPESCSEESQEKGLFSFEEMTDVDWPLSDYGHFTEVTEDWCRQACLDDCFCDVAIFGDQGDCWKKRTPLSNGRTESNNGRKILIKVRKDNSTSEPSSEGNKDQSTLIITESVLLGGSVFLNCLLLLSAFLYIFRKRKSKTLQPHQAMVGANLKNFSYKALEVATDGFKDELGRGAFSTVYKGTLAHDNGQLVAVKKLDRMVRGVEVEFETEVSAIGRTNHKNLVQLLGFCNEGQHRLLVYEFMSNGSLATFLFGNSRPHWDKRTQIILGTARGLLYLHEECSTQIIHCDIKPQNILLDDFLTARISDFGLAKLLRTDQTRTTTGIRGTKGYVAPEWFKTVPVTAKVDVYSFGIVLLELIFCRKNFETAVEDENQMVLADWAYDSYLERKLDLLVEKDQEALDNMEKMEKFVMIAIWCIQEDPSQRPTMKKVTQMLEGAIEVPLPPDPSPFSKSFPHQPLLCRRN
ncbi:hypothetical protein PVL29_007140 [Vitis rotundifolia]|uniref:Receptor-like serine/threonine-protein kinase n=1 Tax=Vitis rotundifolia TaxID=103349 RepID=A0AA39DVQ7_VITRO|nr:hypothetical protein PVL29_007140 [Vitis rotundifolia]